MKASKYSVIYSVPNVPNKFYPIPEGLCNGVQLEPVDLTMNKRSSPRAAGSSPSPLKFQSLQRRTSPGLNPSPPLKKLTPPGIQPFAMPLAIPPVMAALSHRGLRSSGILPVIQPLVVQPVPFMYAPHLQQPIMVPTVLSEELENPTSLPGKKLVFVAFSISQFRRIWYLQLWQTKVEWGVSLSVRLLEV